MRGRDVYGAKDLVVDGDMKTLNLSLLLVSICISAGCLAGRGTPLTGQVFLGIAAAMEAAAFVALATRQYGVFDFLHFRMFMALLVIGVFVPGRLVAWAVLLTGLLFITIWVSYGNVCVMLRPPRKGSVASRWATCAVVFYAALRLILDTPLPGWSVWVGVGYALALAAYAAGTGARSVGFDVGADDPRGGARR